MRSSGELPKGYRGLRAIGMIALGWALFAFVWSFLHPEHSAARLAATFVPLMIGLGVNLVISLRRNDWKFSGSDRSPNPN